MRGAVPDSTEVTFTPRQIRPGEYYADTQTAGLVKVVRQYLILLLL